MLSVEPVWLAKIGMQLEYMAGRVSRLLHGVSSSGRQSVRVPSPGLDSLSVDLVHEGEVRLAVESDRAAAAFPDTVQF